MTLAESVYEQKRRFVKNHLEPLIKAVDGSVDAVVYSHGGQELVTIYYDNEYSRRIDVGGDSLAALTRDVMRNL